MRRGPGRPANTPDVLWAKIDRRGPDECWPWLGWKNHQGYGRTEIKDRSYFAHRVIYALTHPGEIELSAPRDANERGFVMHTCDNPVCCNPAHLRLGTHRDNMQDKIAKGRAPDFKGERGPRAKLTAQDVADIRWIASKGIAASEMARLYGVHKSTIKHAISGRHY